MPECEPVQPSRRALLSGASAAALTVVLAGCRRKSTPARPLPAPTPPPDPDAALVAEAVRSKQRVLALYAAVVKTHPGLDKRLRWVVAEHREHLAALASLVDERASTSSTTPAPGSSTPTPVPGSSTPTPAATAGRVPRSEPSAVAVLVASERALAESRLTAAVRSSALLARTLASIGASEAVHAALLEAPL